jgi:hypothetical protein
MPSPQQPAVDLGGLPADFSLVLGGPLYQLFRRTRLSGGALELVRRRIVVITLLAWIPLLVLTFLDGVAYGDKVAVPFLLDIDAQVRFLVALPLLVVAELVVHVRMRTVLGQFELQGLVPGEVRAAFDAAVASAMRLRNSTAAEVVLIAIVYGVGILVLWRAYLALDVPTWYASPADGRLRPRLAGWWYLFVSLPLFQFLLLRWYFRFVVWARFLWKVSRLPLAYAPMHPDRMGGIGFLSRVSHAFAPVLFAQGAILAGTLANRIFYEGAKLTAFSVEIAAFVAVAVFIVVGPLLVFVRPLADAKREALRDYGHLARRYVDTFEDKWLRGAAPPGEPLVGSADIQSLADLGNSFEIVKGMRMVPITRDTVVQLAVVTLLPIAPLLLTMVSMEQILERALGFVF